MDPMQTMITMDALTKNDYTPKMWLTYYRNVWIRNTVARSIDVVTDQKLKKEDPEQMVEEAGTGQIIPVKQRLEARKIAVQDGLNIIAGIDRLLTLPADVNFEEKYWSKEALAVDEDMLPPKPKIGDACEIDGKAGVLEEKDGKLVCAVKPEANAGPSSEAKV